MSDDERARVLEAAMGVFWRKGAERATYDDIVAATGSSRKGLYAAWPEKNMLIADALLYYRARILEALMEPLGIGGREGLSAFWRQLRAAMRRPEWRGCLLMRTSGGALRDEPFVGRIFGEYVETLHRRIAAAISVGRKEGTISEVVEPATAAWQSVGLLNLMSVRGAQFGYDKRIEEMVRAAESACGLKTSGDRTKARTGAARRSQRR